MQDAGGVSASGNAKVTTPKGKPGSAGDPFAGLAAPAASGPVLSVNLGGSSSQTINPGTYSSIQISGNAKLTLNPGLYIIAGGGISVSGNAGISVSGTAGVTIYNAGSNVLGGGGAVTYGGIGLSGNGPVQLSASVAGPYAGVLVFQSRDNTRALALRGNAALGITGMIYAPKALLGLSGNAQLQSHVPMVVDQLQLSGNGSSSLSTEGSGPSAGQLLAGNLSLYIDDPSATLDASARARIDDAIAQIDALLVPYSVTVTLTSDASMANLVLDTATTSASGGYADGVLGNYSDTGEITLIRGWNWFTGSNPASIAADQFDFETIVAHELGHALGLGHSANTTSTMFASLAASESRRSLVTADLGIRDSGGGPDGLHATRPQVTPPADAVASALEGFYQILPAPASSPAPAPGPVATPARGHLRWIGGRAIPAVASSLIADRILPYDSRGATAWHEPGNGTVALNVPASPRGHAKRRGVHPTGHARGHDPIRA